MEKPRHLKIRHDVFTHSSTAWMHPEHLAVFVLAGSSSTLGVCTYSPHRIARMVNFDTEGIRAVLHALDHHGICKWYPDDEILWCINRADEARVAGSAWRSAQREIRSYPQHVQRDIVARYPVLAMDLSDADLSAGGRGVPKPVSKSESTPATHRGYPPPGSPVSGLRSPVSGLGGVSTQEAEDARIAGEVAVVRDELTRIKPSLEFPLIVDDAKVAAKIRGGETAQGIIDTVRALADRIDAGDEDRSHWRGTYVFSGWYESLRQAANNNEAPKEKRL